MHGLHKCLDGVDKGESSAVDLHEQNMPFVPMWIKLAAQQYDCWARGKTNSLQLAASQTTAMSSKQISRQCMQVNAYQVDADDEPVEGEDHCRHTSS